MFITKQTIDGPEIKKVLKWKSSNKTYEYYDKEEKKTIDLPLPIVFSVVATSAKFTWYSEKHEAWIYSNEVHSIKTETMVVKTSKWDLLAEWLYNTIKDKVNWLWGKYTTVVYWLLKDTKELIKIEVSWAALSSLINDKVKLKEDIRIASFWEAKKWSVNYSYPIFENIETKYTIPEWEYIVEQCDLLEKAYKSKQKLINPLDNLAKEFEASKSDILTPAEIETKLKENWKKLAKKAVDPNIKPEDLPF